MLITTQAGRHECHSFSAAAVAQALSSNHLARPFETEVEVTLHRIDQVVADWGIGSDMKDPVGFMKRLIKAGKITAHKMGRTYWMTDEEIQQALDATATRSRQPAAQQSDPVPHRKGPSAASLKRRIA